MVRRAGPTRARCGRPAFWRPSQLLPRVAAAAADPRGAAAKRRRGATASISAPGAVRGRVHYLRDCGPGHVLLEAPTRAGKGVNTMVPTLLAWPHSALIHDFKRELWPLTAGARRHNGSLCFKFDPANPDDPGVKYNPLEEVRLRTPYETADVQNLVRFWSIRRARVSTTTTATGSRPAWRCLTGAMLHLLYAEPTKTLRGLIGLLSDPESKILETIERIMTAEHDPSGDRWAGVPHAACRRARIHWWPRACARCSTRPRRSAARVVSEVVKRLPLYRDPLIDAATESSDFSIDDLVNHARPASLYLVVPWESRDRLRPLTRLMINQIVRRLTAKLAFKDGRPVSPHRRPLLLMLDEFGAARPLRSIRRGDEPYGRLRLARLSRGAKLQPDL